MPTHSNSPANSRASSPPLSLLNSSQISWIGGGFLMTLASLPGQTIFIAQFNLALRESFSLSDGEFGMLYTLATLASSVLLIWAGGLADRISPRLLALISLGGLVIVTAGMALVPNVLMLGVALFGLRLFGQGMMVHIAITAMSRWFNRFRGRALSFAQMGMPAGQAVLPFVTTLSIVAFGWRQVWLATGAILLLVLAPLIAYLLRDPPDGKRAIKAGISNPDGEDLTGATGQNWTRRRVLRDPMFYLFLPAIMGPAAIGTLYIFHQANLSALKGWDVSVFTAFFPVLSLSTVIFSIVSGILVDRIGAWRIAPYLLIPLGLSSIALAVFDSIWTIPGFMLASGLTIGMMSPVLGALWAEIYGTAHIGKIRALAASASVFASAIGPGVAGALIDGGFDLERQSYFYGAYSFIVTLILIVARNKIRNRVMGLDAERMALSV